MSVERAAKLKLVLAEMKPGQPVTAQWLAGRGVSPQLAHRYVTEGWLLRLGHGYFCRPGDRPQLHESLSVLPGQFHVGGKTALSWHGYQHNLRHHEPVCLYADKPLRLPDWFRRNFDVVTRPNTLFTNQALAVEHWADQSHLYVSDPERAILELLWGVPQKQTAEEALYLLESMQGLRASLMQPLLESCKSIKVKRLFLHWAKQSSLPVLEDLNLTSIELGSDAPYVRQDASTTLKF